MDDEATKVQRLSNDVSISPSDSEDDIDNVLRNVGRPRTTVSAIDFSDNSGPIHFYISVL